MEFEVIEINKSELERILQKYAKWYILDSERNANGRMCWKGLAKSIQNRSRWSDLDDIGQLLKSETPSDSLKFYELLSDLVEYGEKPKFDHEQRHKLDEERVRSHKQKTNQTIFSKEKLEDGDCDWRDMDQVQKAQRGYKKLEKRERLKNLSGLSILGKFHFKTD